LLQAVLKLAEAPEENETSFRAAAADDEATERPFPGHWPLPPGTLELECKPTNEVVEFIAA